MDFLVLGPIAVTDRSTGPVELGGARQRRLLAALIAHAGRAIDSDELIEIVFLGEPPSGATTTIRSYVARLRRALDSGRGGSSIVTVPSGYRLHLAGARLDATRFERATEVGRQLLTDRRPAEAAEALTAALDLWRGPAYGEFGAEEWIRAEATRLDEQRLEAIGERIEAELACGRTEAAIADLTGLVRTHPLHEQFRGQLMLALHRSGRHAEALRCFEAYRREMIELGLEPTPELVALERGIARHDPALRPSSPTGRALRGYRLGSSLGVGRQGEVFRAVQPQVGRDVAIKVVELDLADDPERARRFDVEARAVSRLEHAHIVPLHDYWREPTAAFMVMRLLPHHLRARLERGPLSIDDTRRMVRQLGSALSAAHRAGLVHGDVRPSNVLLDDTGDFYLSDFCIAGLLDRGRVHPTPEGAAFTPPEVSAGGTIDARTDQFGLAVIVASALTGLQPFGADGKIDPSDVLTPLSELSASSSPALDDVLRRATEWRPDDRYESIEELQQALLAAMTVGARSDDVRHEGAAVRSEEFERMVAVAVQRLRSGSRPKTGDRSRADDGVTVYVIGREELLDLVDDVEVVVDDDR